MSIRSNAPEHIAKLERLRNEVPMLLADSIVDGAEFALRGIRDATPVDSGDLQDAWTAYPTANGAVIGNPLPYATYRGPDPADFFPAPLVEAAVTARIGRLLE
jgi:hypothetical protein